MGGLKESKQALGGEVMTAITEWTVPNVLVQAVQLGIALAAVQPDRHQRARPADPALLPRLRDADHLSRSSRCSRTSRWWSGCSATTAVCSGASPRTGSRCPICTTSSSPSRSRSPSCSRRPTRAAERRQRSHARRAASKQRDAAPQIDQRLTPQRAQRPRGRPRSRILRPASAPRRSVVISARRTTSKLITVRGLNALVTGASSGIGELIALRHAPSEGARVALVARRGSASWRSSRDEIGGSGRRGDGAAVRRGRPRRGVRDRGRTAPCDGLGSIDLLVNNAGYGHHRPFLSWDIDGHGAHAAQVNLLRYHRTGTKGAACRQMVDAGAAGWSSWPPLAGKIGVRTSRPTRPPSSPWSGSPRRCRSRSRTRACTCSTVCPGGHPHRLLRPGSARSHAAGGTAQHGRSGTAGRRDHQGARRRQARAARYPRPIAAAYVTKAIAPGFMRRNVKRTTLGRNPADALETACRCGSRRNDVSGSAGRPGGPRYQYVIRRIIGRRNLRLARRPSKRHAPAQRRAPDRRRGESHRRRQRASAASTVPNPRMQEKATARRRKPRA